MDNDTFAALAKRARPARAVPMPAGDPVHVRDLTLGELRRIDARADEVPDGPEKNVRVAMLTCGYALCFADGSPACPKGPTEADLTALEDLLTTAEINAICNAAVPTKDAAKN